MRYFLPSIWAEHFGHEAFQSGIIQQALRAKSVTQILEQNFFLEPRAAQHSYAFNISRRDSTRSIKGRMPSSLEMARDSSSRDMAFSRSPGLFRWQAHILSRRLLQTPGLAKVNSAVFYQDIMGWLKRLDAGDRANQLATAFMSTVAVRTLFLKVACTVT